MKDFLKRLKHEFWTYIYLMAISMPIVLCIGLYDEEFSLKALPFIVAPMTLLVWYKRGGFEGYKRSL